ncbi:amidohydrolase family protein [Arthrobacter tumbae]|uniref:amidohydrolase family protein n=1 Tax=Arthrobacter tumbae TaxID=163874 RepID=UPI001955FA8B|nr:amidohydrolase family protein [Arthrobacter tumbae]MBM7780930.1 cytosine/adenosine deaminase-related metal-dependent hydrolase [Arthrobacter tumbae]
MILHQVRPWGGQLSDVELQDGRITAIQPSATAPEGGAVAPDASADVVDGRGRLLLPSFSDVHVHLDSTRLGLPFRPHTGRPGVWGMMLNDRENWRTAEAPIADRTAFTLATMIEHGTTRVRSYAQIDADCRLERFDAVVSAREAHHARADVEIIAFPQAGLLLEEGVVPLMEESLKQGADVIGGIDPCQLDRDPVRHLDIVFGLAEKYQVPIDIHLHEPGELGVYSADLILERTRATGMQGRVTISHGYSLGSVSDSTTRRLIDEFAEADIAMATVAPSVRDPLPLRHLTEAGVRVGLGEDGQRDYWSPYGNGDMLDRTWQLAFTNGYRADELIEHCFAVASIGGASILDPGSARLTSVSDRPGLLVGDPAELLLLAGETVTSAIMDRPSDRTVIHRGRVVADQLGLTPLG